MVRWLFFGSICFLSGIYMGGLKSSVNLAKNSSIESGKKIEIEMF